MDRDDVAVWARAPRGVEGLLSRIGGRNPFKEPNFRLSLSEGVFKQAGANWFRWREGSPIAQRGKLFIDEEGKVVQPPTELPISVTAEVRWTRKYPNLKGWILEEWHPAHKFGTPDEWEAQKVPGSPSLCALGPYPSQGRYMLAMPWGWGQAAPGNERDPRFQGRPGLPPESVLIDAVQYVESCRDFWNNLTPENRRRVADDADLAQQALAEKLDNDRAKDRGREILQIVQSSSLEAGRERERWAKEAGLKIGHVGN